MGGRRQEEGLMRFGCCVTLASFVPPAGGARPLDQGDAHEARVARVPGAVRVLEDAGCDFMELGVGLVAPELPEASFDSLRKVLRGTPLVPECFNSYVPADIRLVGPERDVPRIERYVATAMRRMAALGGRVVVFGSGGARRIPDRYPAERAEAELREFLELSADRAQENGVTVAIEPLNRGESNVLNSVQEACEMAARVRRAEVAVLVDFYHLAVEEEPFQHVAAAGDRVAHVHVADTGRRYPGSGAYDYPAFWRALSAAGYDGRVSAECNWRDYAAEVGPALRFLRASYAESRAG
jgi:sugar phosphate isomerase/epimerase